MPYNCWDDCEKGAWFSNPLVQAWIFSGFLFATAKVASVTATMFFNVIFPAAVLIYDFHIFITSSSSFHGFDTNQFNNLLPVGLLAQLVERCTGIAEVKGSNPVQAWILSGLLFAAAKVASVTAMIFFHIILHPAVHHSNRLCWILEH